MVVFEDPLLGALAKLRIQVKYESIQGTSHMNNEYGILSTGEGPWNQSFTGICPLKVCA